jgi:hypothetical protein
MFYYKLFVAFTIITTGLSIPVERLSSNEPERCCVPKQYSSKISLSIGMVLPDATTYKSYVIYLIDILKKIKFILF